MNIKELREKKNLSQEELSLKTGIPRARISKWESGKGNPKTADAKILENFFSESKEGSEGDRGNEGKESQQPLITVVLNLSYVGKKNAESMDKMAEANLINTRSIAQLIALLAPNSDLGALMPSPGGQHTYEDDDLPAEAFLGGQSVVPKKKKVQPVKG